MGNSPTPTRAVIVPASAGSGKTYRIAHEYIYDVLRNHDSGDGVARFDRNFYKRILAVTFTNKATEEMKSRILKEIHLLASGKESDHLKDLMKETSLDEKSLRERAKIVRSLILHDYSHFTILTNDTFFQRILRAFVRELNIDMNFSTELDTAPVLAKSVDELIKDITKQPELRKWLEDLTEERIRDGEKWNIRHAITALTDELFKESTRDIIKNNKDKKALEAAIQEFSASVDERRIAFKAMGKAALDRIFARGYSHDNFSRKFTKVFEKVADGTLDKVSDTIIKHLDNDPAEWFNKGKDTPDLVALATELQSMLVDIYTEHIALTTLGNTQRILNRNFRGFALLHDLQDKVQTICKDENSMLLSETKHAIAGFISESEAPFIYEKVGNYFDKFMIDEFQDTSVKEWNNFLPLLRNAMSQSSDTSVLIVGDVKQSIYRWRGGDWRILGGDVEKSLEDCKSDPLENNWRSLPNIVTFNNLLFTDIIELENNNLNARLDEADKRGCISKECKSELYDTLKKAYSKHEQTPRRKHHNNGFVSITAPNGDNNELLDEDGTPLYIKRIQEILERGFRPCDITILVRKKSEGMDIAKELLRYREQMPEELWFEITTEEALSLATSPAVKLVIAIMRLAINRQDATSLVLYNYLHNNSFATPISDDDNAFLDSIRTMSPEEAFDHITIRYAKDMEGQAAYLLALHEHISRFSAGKVADLSLFEKWWQEKGETLSVRVEKSERAIEILTIHKAKGLENKVIIIPLCSWSLKPLDSTGYITNTIWSKATPNKHLDSIGEFPIAFNSSVGDSLFADGFFRETVYCSVDALNMLYVATTRAKEQLHIFLPGKKSRNSSVSTLLLGLYGNKMQKDSEDAIFCHYEIGTFDSPEPKDEEDKKVKTTVIREHNVAPVSLRFRTSLSRYFAEDNNALTPRNTGIRLHRAFEGATTREEIFAKLDDMVKNGELRQEEVANLKSQISTTLDTTIAGEWFDGSWSALYRERNIVLPNGKSKRPDRVMTRNNEAVVIDYKFGKEEREHIVQIEQYIKVLRTMGYTSVKGYVWYVPMGKITPIGN